MNEYLPISALSYMTDEEFLRASEVMSPTPALVAELRARLERRIQEEADDVGNE